MKDVLVAALLGLAVLGSWLGAFGFLRLRSAFDRLHCIAFVNVAGGVPLLLAAFVADGASTRAFKLLALIVIALVGGSATNHALARAILTRQKAHETA